MIKSYLYKIRFINRKLLTQVMAEPNTKPEELIYYFRHDAGQTYVGIERPWTGRGGSAGRSDVGELIQRVLGGQITFDASKIVDDQFHASPDFDAAVAVDPDSEYAAKGEFNPAHRIYLTNNNPVVYVKPETVEQARGDMVNVVTGIEPSQSGRRRTEISVQIQNRAPFPLLEKSLARAGFVRYEHNPTQDGYNRIITEK